MTKREPSKIMASECILEVRYRPNPKVLDFRGSWAELISEHMKLPEWRIQENRIDIYDKSETDRAFIAYRNAGFIRRNTPTSNYFPEQSSKLFHFLFSLEGFGNSLFVQRFGLRQRFCSSFNGTFEELRERYATRYLVMPDAAKKAIEGDLTDIGGPLNFCDKHGNFKTMSGPMRADQIKEFIGFEANYPDVGLYFDIDYWIKPDADIPEEKVIKLIRNFAGEGWDKHERVRVLLLEG